MEKLSYHLTEFEGPLDLLLHLISKNKLNIYDIQISDLLDQYLAHIDQMKENEMDVASEFLEMAARLVYMKTVSLLPKHEESEELKRELTGQLIEYQECKKVAEMLSKQISFDCFTRDPLEIDFDMTYKRSHRIEELIRAYFSAAGKEGRRLPPPEEKFSGIVSRRIVSVTSRIIHVLRSLWKTETVQYDDLFQTGEGKSELVATFLAVLELIKGKRIRIEEDDCSMKVRLINGGVKR